MVKFGLTDGRLLCRDDYHKWKDERKQKDEQEKQRLASLTPEQRAAEEQEKKRAKIEQKMIFTFDDSNEELMAGIDKSLIDVVRQEAGSGWAKWGSMLSGSSVDQMIALGIKAIIDQNKVIIRQNELIRRELKILNEGHGAVASPSGNGK